MKNAETKNNNVIFLSNNQPVMPVKYYEVQYWIYHTERQDIGVYARNEEDASNQVREMYNTGQFDLDCFPDHFEVEEVREVKQ